MAVNVLVGGEVVGANVSIFVFESFYLPLSICFSSIWELDEQRGERDSTGNKKCLDRKTPKDKIEIHIRATARIFHPKHPKPRPTLPNLAIISRWPSQAWTVWKWSPDLPIPPKSSDETSNLWIRGQYVLTLLHQKAIYEAEWKRRKGFVASRQSAAFIK